MLWEVFFNERNLKNPPPQLYVGEVCLFCGRRNCGPNLRIISPALLQRTLRKAEVPIFDFSSYVFSNGQKMSVIGIDLGNQSCYVATARAGGIELILNDYSNRDTPYVRTPFSGVRWCELVFLCRAFVSFHDQSRSLGTAAKNNLVVNLQNTVFNFKRLLGRKFRDPFVQEELKYLPYRVFETSEGEIGIKVRRRNG